MRIAGSSWFRRLELTDWLSLVGLGLLAVGLAMWSLALAFTVVGALLLAAGLWGDLK